MGRTAIEDILGRESKKQSINQKQKGNTNERAAAKFLAEWTGSEFARTPSSGGLRWKNTPDVCGDVICTDKDFNWKWAVETKHLKEFKIAPVLNFRSMVKTIWEQAREDAKRANREPLLMLRKNGMKAGEFYMFFNCHSTEKLHDLMVSLDCTVIRGEWKDFDLYGFLASELRTHVHYSMFVQLVKK